MPPASKSSAIGKCTMAGCSGGKLDNIILIFILLQDFSRVLNTILF
jgi:hypothetical protein